MDKEFHYYITYLLYFIAGFSKKEVDIIANSSQFVDDNYQQKTINNLHSYPTTINNPISFLFPQLLIPFISYHFIPGDNLKQPLIVTSGNTLATHALINALQQKNPYFIGIATHAFCDTWAHQNFSGIWHAHNAMPGILSSLIPNIGHLDAGQNPDLITHTWHDNRLSSAKIHNNTRFINAIKELLALINFTNNHDIINFLLNSWQIKSSVKRIKLYKNYLWWRYKTEIPEYSASKWHLNADDSNSHYWNFQKAAFNHSQFLQSPIQFRLKVHHELEFENSKKSSISN